MAAMNKYTISYKNSPTVDLCFLFLTYYTQIEAAQNKKKKSAHSITLKGKEIFHTRAQCETEPAVAVSAFTRLQQCVWTQKEGNMLYSSLVI